MKACSQLKRSARTSLPSPPRADTKSREDFGETSPLQFPEFSAATAEATRPTTQKLARSVQRHSLFWLLAANLVGLLLATELLWPALGDALAPLTYGRWMPLHLDWQLYGWCSLPLVGALIAWLTPAREHHSATPGTRSPARDMHGALWLWSAALVLGGASWLMGKSSGKLFLDWHGWARPLLPLAMLVLWGALTTRLWQTRHNFSRLGILTRASFLVVLVAVPPALYWATADNVYPSVNPHSGGATGASLLGSNLGIVAIFGLLPLFLQIRPADTRAASPGIFWGFFALSCAAFALLDHGNASHHALNQIIGLSLLLGWLPVAWIYFRRFAWTSASRPWLTASLAWWTLLLVTGLLTFLPDFSERLKFTHALVAHAHLAMAGLVTSMHIVILNELRPSRPLTSGFWLWQTACALYVATMMLLGWSETGHAAELFRSETWTQLFFATRLCAGLAMTGASARWFFTALR